jgi:signal transduction histidine kinase
MPRPGDCERLVDAIDWAATPLGPRAAWPRALRATVANILHSRQPMLLFWGPERIQFYNDAFVPSFGQGKHPAAMGQRADECWQDAWPVVGAQIDAVTSRGEPAWHADALVPIHRNGRMEEVFWTYSYSPAFDDDGAIAGTLVIVTEMTGRVIAARRLAALSALGAALAEANGRQAVIDALRATVAARPEDLPFAVVDSVRIEIDAEGAAAVAHALAGGAHRPAVVALAPGVPGRAWPEPVTGAFVADLPSGLTCGFGLSPRLPFDDGYRSFVEQIVEQLTSALLRIEHAEATRAIEVERDNLLVHAPVAAALLVGPALVFHLANPRYRALAGRDPTGRSFAEAFPELVDAPLHADLLRVYRSGEVHEASASPVRFDRGAGVLEDGYFDFTVTPLRSPHGDIYGLMIVAVDVTEHVRASRAKDEFLAMLGHELRNPLAPIAAAVELMKRRDGGTTREAETIERQLQYVTRLVDDLLDVSRIARGSIALDRAPVELHVVVARAIELTRHLIDQRGHRVDVDVEREIFVDADEARVIQVIGNLVGNAARYTPPGGTIRVASESSQDRVILRVTDDGIGMDRELLDHVFELFVQGRRGIDRAEGGLGIGLALVKNLVTLHGGTVAAHSAGPGQGAEITVTLPRCARPAARPASAHPTLPAARAPKRIVLVDDNVDAADLLGELLRACGHDVSVAHTPLAGLALVAELEPHVAVLDIGLPDIDGYELARRIRQLPSNCRLIALTGYGQEKDRASAQEAGFEAHFVKPLSLPAFLDLLA